MGRSRPGNPVPKKIPRCPSSRPRRVTLCGYVGRGLLRCQFRGSGTARRVEQCLATAVAWLERIENFLHRQQHVASGDAPGGRARVRASTVLSMVMPRMFSRDKRAPVVVTGRLSSICAVPSGRASLRVTGGRRGPGKGCRGLPD